MNSANEKNVTADRFSNISMFLYYFKCEISLNFLQLLAMNISLKLSLIKGYML